MRLIRHLVALGLVTAAVAAGAATASAHETIAGAEPIAIGGSAIGALHRADHSTFFAVDLELAQRVKLTLDSPFTGDLRVRLFRPGVTDETLAATAPRNVLTAQQGVVERTITADWPGRWIVEIQGASATSFTFAVAEVAAGTPGPVAGAPSIAAAEGMVVGTRYVSATYDPERPRAPGARFMWVQAAAGDRVRVAVSGTNGKPFSAEAFLPGTTDATVATLEPESSVEGDGSVTLGFDAPIDGQWIIRVAAEPNAEGVARPVTFTSELVSIEQPSTCQDNVTDIGLVRVTGCIRVGRRQVTTTEPISFSGINVLPLDGAMVRIDKRTLEVRSDGEFAVDIADMRVLQATNYFVLKGAQTLRVPDDTVLLGMPITGSLTATWSLEHGGSLAVVGTARLTGLGTEGDLSFDVSSDLGLQHLAIRVGVDDLRGIAFSGTLRYRKELDEGELVNVWRGGLNVAVGVESQTSTEDAEVLPAALLGAAGSLEFRDGRLAYLRVAANTRIPIGATGLIVTQLGAALRWSPRFMVAGTGTVVLGPEVNGASVLAIKGDVGWSSGGSCPGSTGDSPNWFGGGEAKVGGWFSIIALDACYQQAETPYVVIRGRSGFGYADIVTGTARFDGYVYGTQSMMVEGKGTLELWGVGAEGNVVLSNVGLAACGATYLDIFGLKRRVEIGAERRWVDGSGAFAFACPDFEPYRSVPVARAARTDGIPITVPTGVDQVNLVVRGAGGAVPGVDVIGPEGIAVAQSSSTTAPTLAGAVFAPRSDAGEMQIALPIIKAGTYLIRAQAGSVVTSVHSSLSRPDVVIRARVLRRDGARILTYRLAGLDGRRVRFVDATRRTVRTVGTTVKGSGVLRLRATSGAHRIQAIVLDERGFAQTPIVVARYRG